MVRTHGLTHLNLVVKDPLRSLRFYERVFGVNACVHDPDGYEIEIWYG